MARAVPRVPAKRDVHRALPPTQQLYALPFPASLPLPVCTDGLCLIGYPNSFLSVYVPPSPVYLLPNTPYPGAAQQQTQLPPPPAHDRG